MKRISAMMHIYGPYCRYFVRLLLLLFLIVKTLESQGNKSYSSSTREEDYLGLASFNKSIKINFFFSSSHFFFWFLENNSTTIRELGDHGFYIQSKRRRSKNCQSRVFCFSTFLLFFFFWCIIMRGQAIAKPGHWPDKCTC